MLKEYIFLIICIIILFIFYCLNRNKKFDFEPLNIYKVKQCIKKKKTNEERCREIIETLLSAKFPKIRPKFFVNPATKKRLELDCYNPNFKVKDYPGGLAFEIDGEQHHSFIPAWHKTRDGFLKQIERDQLKNNLCKQFGILLIRIPSFIENKKEFILKQLINKKIL